MFYTTMLKEIDIMQFTKFKIKNKKNKTYKFMKTLYDLKRFF